MLTYGTLGYFDRCTIAGDQVYLWDSNPNVHEDIYKYKVYFVVVKGSSVIDTVSEVKSLCSGSYESAWFNANGSLAIWNTFCPNGE